MAITPFGPSQTYPRLQSLVYPKRTAVLKTLTTAGGAVTATAAEVLGGLFVINCDDAQTLTLPTAALLNAAIPGAAVGASFEFDVINTGDTTLTIAVGTGGSLATGSNSKSSVATIVANASKRFVVSITGVRSQTVVGSSDAYIVYGMGSIAAAVA